MLKRDTTARFDKDYKQLIRRHVNIELLDEAMDQLLNERDLPDSYNLHPLEPKKKIPKRWEIHLGGRNSNWVLVFYYEYEKQLIVFERTGTHSDLFR